MSFTRKESFGFGWNPSLFAISIEEFRERLEGKVLERGRGFSSWESLRIRVSLEEWKLGTKGRLKTISTRFGRKEGRRGYVLELHSVGARPFLQFLCITKAKKIVGVSRRQAVSKVMGCSCIETLQP